LNDHINLQGTNPLIGPNESRFGLRFFDMTYAYDPQWRQLALREATRIGINVHEGVYVAVPGPSYETPAEIRAFRILGADVAGMSCTGKSTIAEAIAAKVPASIFRLDEYYLNLDHLSPDERARYDFDRPDSLDETLIVQHIHQLAAGNPIQQPVYDFARHTRT